MARYRIEFSREWIRGRWGFIDNIFNELGGRVSEPSRTENAWIVNFKGDARTLGRYMSDRLELTQEHFRQFGSIFEITQVGAAQPNPTQERKRAVPQRRLTAT